MGSFDETGCAPDSVKVYGGNGPYLLTQVPPALNIVYSDVVRFRTHTDTHIALR